MDTITKKPRTRLSPEKESSNCSITQLMFFLDVALVAQVMLILLKWQMFLLPLFLITFQRVKH